MNAYLCLGFSTTDWKALAPRLNGNNESAWGEAIGVFERRMRERYFSSIDALFAADTKAHRSSTNCKNGGHCVPGFSIMALCCLLIETVQRFRESSPDNTAQKFKKFLRRPAFNGTFVDDRIVECFVNGVRNGILHEAETRKWVIRRDEPKGTIASPEEDGFALNRTLFYGAVKTEFETYLTELSEPENQDLRAMFQTKMNDLCKRA
jgi:hypothetical protein